MEKKIFLEKNDGLEVAVEELINAKSDTVILNIPKDSVLGRSVNNFHVLKREGNTAQKVIMIESVDDHILELASLATITAINPVFQKKERAVSDILPRAAVLLKKQAQSNTKKQQIEEENGDVENALDEGIEQKREKPKLAFYDEVKTEEKIEKKSRKNFPGRKKTLLLIGVFVCFGFLLFIYLGWFVLPRATVVMTLKQKSIPFDMVMDVSQNYTKTETSNSKILLRGQLIASQGNLALPISGVTAVNGEATYAGGIITVVNEFGTSQQKLVATTRFETSDGKIFRLRKDIVVPGGTMVKGVLKPGTIEVDVIADKPGDEYNIGPVEKFSIPGFKGTPRFAKFYGFSKTDMTGGSSGIKLSASTSTQGETEESVIEKLKIALEEKTGILNSVGLSILDDAKRFVVTKKDFQISSSTDSTLYVEGVLKEIGFDEKELKTALGEVFKKDAGENMRVRTINISYGTTTPNFASGTLSAAIHGDVLFETDADTDLLKKSILGKDTNEVTAFILSVPGVESAKVTFKPFWVTKIPKDPAKVDFKIE